MSAPATAPHSTPQYKAVTLRCKKTNFLHRWSFQILGRCRKNCGAGSSAWNKVLLWETAFGCSVFFRTPSTTVPSLRPSIGFATEQPNAVLRMRACGHSLASFYTGVAERRFIKRPANDPFQSSLTTLIFCLACCNGVFGHPHVRKCGFPHRAMRHATLAFVGRVMGRGGSLRGPDMSCMQ